MEYQTPSDESSVGCGLLGCAGGLLLGFLGGGPVLVGLALLLALQATPVAPETTPGPDLRVTLQEEFINRVVQTSAEAGARVDILPGNQVRAEANTTVSLMGLTLPVQVVTLFNLQATPQSIQASLADIQVQGVELTPELRAVLGENLPQVNQELDMMMANISDALGVPVILTGLGTTDTQLWLEASEQP